MTHIPLKRELKPCPFCGETGLDFDEGSTFRWLLPSCKGCGATCGEVRVQTMGEGTPGEWRAAAEADAIDAWNRRSALTQQAEPAKAYDLSEARGLIDWTKERDFNHIKPPHKWVLQVDQELRRLIAHIAARG